MRSDVRAVICGIQERGWGAVGDVDDPAPLRMQVRDWAAGQGIAVRTQWRSESRVFSAAQVDRERPGPMTGSSTEGPAGAV